MNNFAQKILENKPELKDKLMFINEVTNGRIQKKLYKEKNNINVLSLIAEIESGYFLACIFGRNSLNYEPKIDAKTPDWLVCSNNQNIIVEVRLLNQEQKKLEHKINAFLNGENIRNTKTAFTESYDETFRKQVSKLAEKGKKYGALVRQKDYLLIPYIDTIGLDNTIITEDDLKDYLDYNCPLFQHDVGEEFIEVTAGIFAKAKFTTSKFGTIFSNNSSAKYFLNEDNLSRIESTMKIKT